ncbi:FK506-binding protein 15 isoform X2 [Pseudonaja textilis]|uniref:FK506-binding protein 15 isoform X2 n=1 Tax=Pseudonaja textilis TaxID=8673 RepID=UPI000EA99B93|nr:FK506-binding protein 15 isoform X2 [Pseudonaja textilis]
MYGGAEEEDADFVSPTGGARLASLFGMDQTSSGTGNEFFQYTAPKQPKKNLPAPGAGPPTQKPPPPAGAPSVFVATAVHAYRFTNGTYVKQGKYGAAVVGCHTTQEYRILLYINQQQQITSARIHPGFVFTIQPNNYGTFYDDQRQNWSLMFESEKAAVEFSKQLCLAKYNSSPSPDSVTCQDLILGDGPAVEVGDALEVAFTGWLFQNSALGQVFDSNVNKEKLLRLKLGSGKIIKGWEEGMLGLKKGSKRFLVIPPALAYGSQGVANRVPPDSTLAFEVEVKRVRLAKEAASNEQHGVPRDSLAPSPGPNTEHLSADPAGLPPSTLPPKPGEPAVRAKSNSLSEQLANPDMAKAKLISRMAKMGQPMLPFLSGSAPAQLDSSDSEIEDPNTLREAAHPVTSSPLKPSSPAALPQITAQGPQVSAPGLQVSSAAVMPTALHPHPALPGSSQSLQAYTGMNYAYPQGPASASQLQPMGPIFPAPFQAGDIGTFLMTEARQQNTEIRLSVGRVADKIDQLAAKMEELQKQNSTQSLLPGISSVTMETAMIMANIQRIIQENERLKQEVFEKSSRIEEQNEKISELIQRNQRYVEQSNLLMEQRNSSLQMNTEHSQARVLHAEQEKYLMPPDRGWWDQVKVAEELAAATAQVSRLQLELTSHQKKEMDLRSQLNAALKESERHAAQLNQLQAQLAELQESSEKAKNKFQAEKQSRKQLDGKLAALEEELADLRVEKENLEKNLSERKKKSLLERKQAEEEADEIRKSYQEEMDQLRLLLKKSRASTNNVASEQLSLLQTELESQWEARCERLLSSAKEQHARQFQEVCEQRDAQQQVISQLEEKISLLKAGRISEVQNSTQSQDQIEELEAVKRKCAALQSQLGDLTAHYEGRIQELTKSIHRTSPTTSGEEVKKIMNGVFHSLRGQFEIEESYTGRIVLGVVMSTIKTITLQLLERSEERSHEEQGPQQRGSPVVLARDQPASPDETPAVASPVPSDHVEEDPNSSVLSSEGSQSKPEQEAQHPGTPAELTPAPSDPVPKSPEVEKEEEVVSSGPTEAPAVEVGGAEEDTAAGPVPLKPAVEEAVPTPEPEREEDTCPDVPDRDPTSLSLPSGATEEKVQAKEMPPPASTPPKEDSSAPEEEANSLKATNCKLPSSAGPLEEEEDDDELSFKGRPPPTPLFADDEDDEDLDWLG